MRLAEIETVNEKKRIRLSAFSSIVLVFILSGFITLVSLFIQPGSFAEVIRTFLAQPLLILLNWFPPLVLTAVLYFLIGNVFYGGAIAGTIISVMSYINLLKIEGREDTFVPADITLLREAVNAVEEYELPMHYGKIAVIVFLAAIAVVLGIFIKS